MTYHGPGQLVAYPIFDIRALGLGARAFVESLEDSVVSTLGELVAVKEFGNHNSQQGTFAVSRHVRGIRLAHMLSAADRWQATVVCWPNACSHQHRTSCSLPDAAGAYGIVGRGRVPGATGVWVEDRKIAAIGVKISHGVR